MKPRSGGGCLLDPGAVDGAYWLNNGLAVPGMGRGVNDTAEDGKEWTMAASIAVLEGICAAFNAHDLDAIMAFFVDDCVLEMPRGPDPWGRRAEGREAVRALLATRFAGLPDVHYGDERHFVDGDTGISTWTITGTPVGGGRIEVNGCDFYTFRGERIVKKNSFWKIREG